MDWVLARSAYTNKSEDLAATIYPSACHNLALLVASIALLDRW
jgi:hypothetical protein